jgi:hypothetical protein
LVSLLQNAKLNLSTEAQSVDLDLKIRKGAGSTQNLKILRPTNSLQGTQTGKLIQVACYNREEAVSAVMNG